MLLKWQALLLDSLHVQIKDDLTSKAFNTFESLLQDKR
ncbi:hypothetical protein A1Q_4422 [Vibrio campbellii HY01]|nr:hypothetical protein A1Q_4422 [Vibrio campbellii HY01]